MTLPITPVWILSQLKLSSNSYDCLQIDRYQSYFKHYWFYSVISVKGTRVYIVTLPITPVWILTQLKLSSNSYDCLHQQIPVLLLTLLVLLSHISQGYQIVHCDITYYSCMDFYTIKTVIKLVGLFTPTDARSTVGVSGDVTLLVISTLMMKSIFTIMYSTFRHWRGFLWKGFSSCWDTRYKAVAQKVIGFQ